MTGRFGSQIRPSNNKINGKYSEAPKSINCQNPDAAQFSFQTDLSDQNPHWTYLDALYVLVPLIGQVVKFGIQTAVSNLDDTNRRQVDSTVKTQLKKENFLPKLNFKLQLRSLNGC